MELWFTALVALGSALFGALVGGVSTAILQLWGQVLRGLAASRITRLELNANITFVQYALTRTGSRPHIREDAWLDLRADVAPLLNQPELIYVDAVFRFVPLAKDMAQAVMIIEPDPNVEPHPELKKHLTKWQEQLFISGLILKELEQTGRSALLWRNIRSPRDLNRQVSPEEIEERFRIGADDTE